MKISEKYNNDWSVTNYRWMFYMISTAINKMIGLRILMISSDVNMHEYLLQKYPGVQIDSNTTWKHHIEYTCKKSSKYIGIFCKVRKKLTKSYSVNLYYPFANPCLIYWNRIWGINISNSYWKCYSSKECYQNCHRLPIQAIYRTIMYC